MCVVVDCSHYMLTTTADFRRRMLSLLGYAFRTFPASLALSVLHAKQEQEGKEGEQGAEKEEGEESKTTMVTAASHAKPKVKSMDPAHSDRAEWEAVSDALVDGKAELYRLVSPYDLKRCNKHAYARTYMTLPLSLSIFPFPLTH